MLEVISFRFLWASFVSGAMNLANTAAAILAFNYASGKSNRHFLIYNLGGMVVRMFVLLLIFFVVLKFFNLDKFGFIFTFFVSYFIFLSIEINYFRLKVLKGNS